jgi:ribosomal-protein-alanine N-acetyltransferase
MIAAVPENIETVRLVLRRLAETDAEALLAAVDSSRSDLECWLRWPTRIRTLADARALAADATEEQASWERAIFRQCDDALIGGIDARVLNAAVPSFALGYWLRTDATGHGYMREAVRAMTGILFDRAGARRVAIGCDPANWRSARVAETCGFIFEARLRNEIVYPVNDVRDLLIYSLIDTDEAAGALAVDMPEALDDPVSEEQ